MGEPTPGRDSGPPGFLQLAGHPVRWRLLRELARSDRQVREPRAPARVLFLCTGNGARSQMAEALAQRRSGGLVQAFSAGSHPRSLHPNTVRVMAERGIDLLGRAAKHLSVFAADRFGYVITLCDRVREVCPEFPGHPRHIHWSIPDPAAAGDTDEASYPAFQATAAELEARIGFLLAAIAATPARSAHQEA